MRRASTSEFPPLSCVADALGSSSRSRRAFAGDGRRVYAAVAMSGLALPVRRGSGGLRPRQAGGSGGRDRLLVHLATEHERATMTCATEPTIATATRREPILICYDDSPDAARAIEAAAALLIRRAVVVDVVPWMTAAESLAATSSSCPAPPSRANSAEARRIAGRGAEIARSVGFEAEPRGELASATWGRDRRRCRRARRGGDRDRLERPQWA